MPLSINLRHLENQPLSLAGELTPEAFELGFQDELVHATLPLTYELEVELLDKGVLVQGNLRLPLQCECARCLTPFQYDLELTDWAAHLPLEGEDAVPVVNDSVDLTPFVREDILLAIPQHPLCEPECPGLAQTAGQEQEMNGASADEEASPVWAELNKLKIEKE